MSTVTTVTCKQIIAVISKSTYNTLKKNYCFVVWWYKNKLWYTATCFILVVLDGNVTSRSSMSKCSTGSYRYVSWCKESYNYIIIDWICTKGADLSNFKF